MLHTLLLVGLLNLGAGCAGQGGQTSESGSQEAGMETKSIEEVLREQTPRLMAVRGVTGTGLGECDGAPCIVVFVVRHSPELLEEIPDTLDGYPVDVRVSGRVRAREESPD
jgi:hypothetical protein